MLCFALFFDVICGGLCCVVVCLVCCLFVLGCFVVLGFVLFCCGLVWFVGLFD